MRSNRLSSFLTLACLFLFGIGLKGQTITVDGPGTVCVNSATSYSNPTPTPGLVYQWSLNIGGTIIGSGTGAAINIQWGSTPVTATLTVNGVPPGGGTPVETGSKVIDIVDRPKPLIFSDYQVACQNYAFDSSANGTGSHGETPPTQDPDQPMADDDGCSKVCAGALVTYTSSTIPASHNVSWDVSGGTIISGQNTSTLEVQWGQAGMGSITLYQHDGECVGEKTLCVEIVEKPQASFAVLPNMIPQPDETITVCFRSQITLMNLSEGSPLSPIVSYYWDFGNNQVSSQKDPPSYQYSTPGTYTVTLTVKNACGCTDVFQTELNVIRNQGPSIQCASVACENTEATYSTNAVCGSYDWSVLGGTITQNNGDNITVLWDNAAAFDGFGYVSLSVPDCPPLCQEKTTIKVPIVLEDPEVFGPQLLCVDNQYQFSVPLWPGTQYSWGVINTPTPSPIIGTRNDHKVAMDFSTPGTYTLHLTYQNRIALCGGDIQFDVTVVPRDSIIGPSNACRSTTPVTYTLDGAGSAGWMLISPTSVVTSSTGTSFNAVFDEVGLWTLTATGTVCPTTISIQVDQLQTPVDSVQGKRIVCLNKLTTYEAFSALPGMIHNWEITSGAGTMSKTSGDHIAVTWTTLPATLVVRKQSTTFPYCMGPEFVLNITEDLLDPTITGPDVVCANNYNDFSANYYREDASYTWEVIPQVTGSVTAGNYEADITFLANHFLVDTPAQLKVNVKQCGVVVSDIFDFLIVPHLEPEISAPDTVCSGEEVTFIATPGAANYSWDFGDGSPTVITVSNIVEHTYYYAPFSPLGSPMLGSYTVTVFATGGDGVVPCPPKGTGTFEIEVMPGSDIGVVTFDPLVYPPGTPISTLLQSLSASGVTLGYQWYRNGVLIPGATNSNYLATSDGEYHVVVSSPNGCKNISNITEIVVQRSGGGQPCPGTLIISATNDCGVVTALQISNNPGGSNPLFRISNIDSPHAHFLTPPRRRRCRN